MRSILRDQASEHDYETIGVLASLYICHYPRARVREGMLQRNSRTKEYLSVRESLYHEVFLFIRRSRTRICGYMKSIF